MVLGRETKWNKPQGLVNKILLRVHRLLGLLKRQRSNPESAANCLICLIHQTNFLLDRQLESLDKEFIEKGGFTENLYKRRL